MNKRPELGTFGAIGKEVKNAREQFPSNEKLLAALVEEVGELAQAMIEDDGTAEEEAVQVAAMAIRLIEEGDSDFEDWTGNNNEPAPVNFTGHITNFEPRGAPWAR